MWARRRSMFKTFAMTAFFVAASANAATVEKTFFGTAPKKATCGCKGKGDCTCPRGQCKCKTCGIHAKPVMFEAVKGSKESTRLPDTARVDARGGVFI